MFNHVYCLQPSAADNPWLNKLLVIPRGSVEKYPHLFRNDFSWKKAALQGWCTNRLWRRQQGWEREPKNLLTCQKWYLDIFELEDEAACEAMLLRGRWCWCCCCSMTHCCGAPDFATRKKKPGKAQWQRQTRVNLWPWATQSSHADSCTWGIWCIYRKSANGSIIFLHQKKGVEKYWQRNSITQLLPASLGWVCSCDI